MDPDLARHVNPFSGTAPGGPDFGTGGGAANTFPGADVPFGMVQWSPDTVHQQPGGYHYPDDRIRGFSLTHLSGAGCDAGQDIPFLPYPGEVRTSPATDRDRYVATFSHDNETATPGYYAVTLDSGATMELTVTQRSGIGRITYPADAPATLLVDVAGSVRGVSDAHVEVGDDSISGWAVSGDFCGSGNVYRVYFSATFDRPFQALGTWHEDSVSPAPTASGPGSGAFVTFDLGGDRTVQVRVGLSYVSVAGAAANVVAEQGTSTFDEVRARARAAWNARLGQIEVTGGTAEQTTIFYTQLYHSLLQPNVFSDADGRYIGFDGEIHKCADGHVQYANFSGWDIYRSQIQLLALLAPAETADMAQSMLNQARQSGDVWDRWSHNNDFTGVMTGDPYHSILASAYAFGATDFDAAGALASMVHGATTVQPHTASYVERPGLADYQTLGYVPGAPSTTLEYTTADFGIAQLAARLGDTTVYQQFLARAQYWQNLFHPATGHLQPRHRDGSFRTPFDPASPTRYIEGNGAQYAWMVPYNLRALINARGGDEAVIAGLDTFFTELNAGPRKAYAFLGNEPSLNAPWVYVYAGAPHRTQEVVRRAVNTLWRADASGFVGNNDLGAMSSWYIWAALGLYPQVPGRAELVLGSPLFPRAVLRRATGQTITIDAPGASADRYAVAGVLVNGAATAQPWLPESFAVEGGAVEFTLVDQPDPGWGAAPADVPPSYRDGERAMLGAFHPGEVRIGPGDAAVPTNLVIATVTGAPTTVAWAADAPAGLVVDPAGGTVDVPAHGPVSVEISVSTAPHAVEAFHRLPITLTSLGEVVPAAGALTVRVARPGSVLWHANNVGVSDDAATTDAALDRGGFSYSAQALAATGVVPGGQVRVGAFTFVWPGHPAGQPDNIQAGGGDQTLELAAAPAAASRLALLGVATNGNASGDATIRYADGTAQTARIGFGDWITGADGAEGPRFGNAVAARMAYRNAAGGQEPATTYLFATAPIVLRAGRRVASITLPAEVSGGDLHVFAVAVV
ncbi:MAG TPA: GH92 family glycosyl hydrolase [Micromonosporaceae bacterium]|nr:GH92 family glycosyl hydrolase [Micromonosporaceae bacterium]